MKLTARKICDAAAKRHNLDPEWVDLSRDQGTWYWGGKAACVFDSSMVSYINLNDWPIERWLEDFDSHVSEWQENPFNSDRTLREYINSITWELEE
jgi:hypothetical protein